MWYGRPNLARRASAENGAIQHFLLPPSFVRPMCSAIHARCVQSPPPPLSFSPPLTRFSESSPLFRSSRVVKRRRERGAGWVHLLAEITCSDRGTDADVGESTDGLQFGRQGLHFAPFDATREGGSAVDSFHANKSLFSSMRSPKLNGAEQAGGGGRPPPPHFPPLLVRYCSVTDNSSAALCSSQMTTMTWPL